MGGNWGPIGWQELVVVLFISLVFLWPWWRIFKKAGYPGALGLLMLVPGINILMVLYLAFADWPSLRRRV